MKKLKYVKLFEEFNTGYKIAQNLVILSSELLKLEDSSDEGKKKRKEIQDQIHKVEGELKEYLSSTYDVEISFISGQYSDGGHLYIYFNIPEGFFSKVKRFFGFGLSQVQIQYTVQNIGELEYDVTGLGAYQITPEQQENNKRNCQEEVSLFIGTDRRNIGDDVDKKATGLREIELPTDAAMNILQVIREINPSTSIRNPQQLVDELNKKSQDEYKNYVEWGKRNPTYTYAVPNKILLVD